MKEGPDISRIGSLIGDPARANMLAALMDGRALTATELAAVAGITVQTASSHLAKLESGGLLSQQKQGRHRYFTLTDDAVGAMLESLMGFAADRGHMRFRTGPKDPALRKARVCYNHLAGDYGVKLFESLLAHGDLVQNDGELDVTPQGEARFQTFGIAIADLRSQRRVLCRHCLDWSERRMHLAGVLGERLLTSLIEKSWARRSPDSRAILFSAEGERQFHALFGTPNESHFRHPQR